MQQENSLENLDWPQVKQHMANFATSADGKDQLLKWQAQDSLEQALKSLETIVAAQALLSKGERPYMESLDIYPTWIHRLEKQSQLKPLELKDVRLFLLETQTLRKILTSAEDAWSGQLREQLMGTNGPLSAIDLVITPQADIKMDASEKLFKLSNEKKNQAQKIHNTLNKLVKTNDNEDVLQDRFVTNREGRWVVPVKSGMRHELPGIIHASSNSKQTVFIEPQDIVPLNNDLKRIESDIEVEIERLLNDLSTYLFSLYDDFLITKDLLLEADLRFAQAQFSTTLSAQPFEFDNDKILLEDVKHPVMVLNDETVIPNTLELSSEQRLLLLSGPNAGGKTVLLKCIGLAAQMARCGLPICAAPTSRLPFFKDICSAVGDAQSVDSQLSTFEGHITTLNEAGQLSSPQSLVLVDEICGSTDPEEGSALARAFIEHYSEQGVFSIITSHLGPLKTGWSNDSGVINGSMEYNNDSGGSTYHFIPGVPGQSLAFSTAARIGINEKVYQTAQKYLSPETRKRLESMNEVEQIKAQMSQLREQLQEKIKGADKLQVDLKKKLIEFEKNKDSQLKQEVKDIKEKLLEEARKDNINKIFNDHDRRSRIEVDFPEIIKKQKQPAPSETLESFEKAFPPGSLVYVASLKQDAIIQGRANNQGQVPVLAGSMRLLLDWEELRPPKKATNPLTKRNFSKDVVVEFTDRGNHLDLRGKTVSDAISELELFLDSALARRQERVSIVHGHGSEALKKAVRSHLSRSVNVNRWTTASEHAGDDGGTYAYLSID